MYSELLSDDFEINLWRQERDLQTTMKTHKLMKNKNVLKIVRLKYKSFLKKNIPRLYIDTLNSIKES